MDLVAVIAAADRRGLVGILCVARSSDLLVEAEITSGKNIKGAFCLCINELIVIGIRIEIDQILMVRVRAGVVRTAVIGTAVADIDVAGLVYYAVQDIVSEFGDAVPGMIGGIRERIRSVGRLGDPEGQQPASGIGIILSKSICILIGVQPVSVGSYRKRILVESAADRKQVVEHAAFLGNERTAARRSRVSFVHADRPGKTDVLIDRIVYIADRLLDLAVAYDTGGVVHTALGAGAVRRTGVVVSRVNRKISSVAYSDLVVLLIICGFDCGSDLRGSKQGNEGFCAESRFIMLVGCYQSVAGAGPVTENNCLA